MTRGIDTLGDLPKIVRIEGLQIEIEKLAKTNEVEAQGSCFDMAREHVYDVKLWLKK